MKTKAIIFDIDGTAMSIGEGNWPTARLKGAIRKLQDRYHVSVATGRPLRIVADIIDFLGIKDISIIAGGTEIYDPKTKSIIWREKIPLAAYPLISSAVKKITVGGLSSGEAARMSAADVSIDKLLDGEVSIIYILAIPKKIADSLEAELRQRDDLKIMNMHSYWKNDLWDVHIHSAAASKEHAVWQWLSLQNFSKKDSIVIGDGLNDLHLFNAGGLKVAMGNAVPELKAASDLVIGDVADDGLAEYLESL